MDALAHETLRARAASSPAVRASLVAATWVLGALPALLGVAQCPAAHFFHVPCPGCGMTRAALLFLHGDLAGSFAMHPLVVPVALATLLVAVLSVQTTLTRGSPLAMAETRAGRTALVVLVAAHVASIALWALRIAGLFGGPVAV